MSSHVYTYNLTHSVTFLSDAMRNVLRDLIVEYGLDPAKLTDDWDVIERGIRAWINSGHLEKIVIEFYRPGSDVASARWDFPVLYTGSGVSDDMWHDKTYFRQLIAKSARPSSDCFYTIILKNSAGRPEVDGFVPATFRSTAQLARRDAGTVVATGHLSANAEYWR